MIDLVSSRTELKRAGSRYTGLCPFHDERTPSFGINPAEKVYHCFGCQASGDAFTFVMETEGVDFRGALELLADRYKVALELEDEDPAAAERRSAATGCSSCSSAPRRTTCVSSGSRARPSVRASTSPGAACRRRRCASFASATRRAPGTSSSTPRAAPASQPRALRRRLAQKSDRAAGSTTASARRSSSRSPTSAAGSRVRGTDARRATAPTAARSTSTARRARSSTRAATSAPTSRGRPREGRQRRRRRGLHGRIAMSQAGCATASRSWARR